MSVSRRFTSYPSGFISSCVSDYTGLVRPAGEEPRYFTSVEVFLRPGPKVLTDILLSPVFVSSVKGYRVNKTYPNRERELLKIRRCLTIEDLYSEFYRRPIQGANTGET